MTRDSFVFYRSFWTGLKALSDEDRLACYDAIVGYGLDGISEASGVAAAVLALTKPIIDSNNKRFLNGTKGGRPRTKPEPTENQTETKEEPKQNQTETKVEPYEKCEMRNVKGENIKEGEKPASRRAVFQKPTPEEVRAYCRERNNRVDPEAFCDFYDSKGWKVGSQPMKDWKAAVRTWEKREKPKKGFDYSDQRTYDYKDLERRLLAR